MCHVKGAALRNGPYLDPFRLSPPLLPLFTLRSGSGGPVYVNVGLLVTAGVAVRQQPVRSLRQVRHPGLGVVVPLLHDVDVLEVSLWHEHGHVANVVAEVLQLAHAVELEDGPLVTVWRDGDVDLVRLGLPGHLAAIQDHRRDAHPHGPTGPQAPDLVPTDTSGVPRLLTPQQKNKTKKPDPLLA